MSEKPPNGAAALDEIAKVLREVGIPAPQIVAALAQLEPLISSHTAAAKPVNARLPSAAALKRREAAERRRQEAAAHFENALALEDSDLNAARSAYMAALTAHGDHLEARINLGRLLHLQGNLREAEKIYRAARHSSATLSFNLAILLEDLGREAEAVVAYREALALDPGLHDAHYNLSRLHESAARPQEALRHLLAYRRHVRHEED